MVIWGGQDGSLVLNTGGTYDPITNTWLPTNASAPAPRYGHSSIWTGRRMIVWGGESAFQQYLGSGGSYDPTTDSWSTLSLTESPLPRLEHRGVWTGSDMIIWGGAAGAETNSGSSYSLDHALDGDSDGWTECAGDCNDFLPSVFPGALETCDGRDNNCDGTVDEGFVVPGTVAALVFPSRQLIGWQAVAGADGYDLVVGNLQIVRNSGNFSNSILDCLQDSNSGTTAVASEQPAPGNPMYYVVRATSACKRGSYGSEAAEELPKRDTQIDQSPAACP